MTVAPTQDLQELLRLAIGPACHELRSPLAVVYGFARMLEGHDHLDEAAITKYVQQIVRSSERLDHLLDDLSRLGRVAAGRLHPQLDSVALREVVEDLVAAEGDAGRLQVDVGADVHVKVDRAWLLDALQAVVDGLCFEDGIRVHAAWQHEPHEVQLHLVPSSAFPMVDVEPEASSLGISLARMRVVAMGGSFEGTGDRIVVTLPRG